MKRMVRKWKRALPWMLTVSMLLGCAMAIYTYRYEQDRYSAAYTFYALPAEESNDDSLQAARMLALECERVSKMDTFRELVLSQADTDGNSYIQVKGVDGTHLIDVQVTGTDQTLVAGLANVAGQELMRYAESSLASAKTTEIQVAFMPQQPSGPNRPAKIIYTILIVFAVCSLLSLLFGDGSEYIHAGFDAGQNLVYTPYLGATIRCKKDVKRFIKKSKISKDQCKLLDSVDRLVLESIRSIAVTLRSKERVKETHSIAVTSLRPDEGKSVFTALLASELAQQGFRVLLVDLQGKSLMLEKMLGADCKADLSEYVLGSKNLADIMTATSYENLLLISRKRQESSASYIVTQPKFTELLSKSTEIFDFVIFNMDPISYSSDASLVSAMAGATILTAKDGLSTVEQINAATQGLCGVANHLMGVVITETAYSNMHLFANE